MNPAQQASLHNLQLLNQKAIDDFNEFFEQTGKKMCSAPHQSIAALSHLYCFSMSLNDLQLPLNKSYTFIFSSWVQAALYQVVHEGLKVLNVAYEHLNMIASNTTKLAEAMVGNIHCAVMLQDNPQLIVISPEFIESITEVKKVLQLICSKFQEINNLIAELVETIKEANPYSPAVRDNLLLALADISIRFNNGHLLWTWISETMDVVMFTLNANRDNEIEIQTLSDAHKSACFAFQSAVVLIICADICKDFGIQLLSMDELIMITNSLEMHNKQVEIQQSIAQLANTNNATIQNMFKQYLSNSENIKMAATSTAKGYLKITAVGAIIFNTYQVYTKLDGLKSPAVKNSYMPIWNHVFPQLKEFEKTCHTAHFETAIHEIVGGNDFRIATFKFDLSSSHLDSKEPFTLQKTLDSATKMSVCVSAYKFKL